MKRILFLAALLCTAACKNDDNTAELHNLRESDLVNTSWKIASYIETGRDVFTAEVPERIRDNILTLTKSGPEDKNPGALG